jgi:hypothetical protein
MKKIFLLAFGIIAFINLFSQTNIENYIEGRKYKNYKTEIIIQYGYISSLNTYGITLINKLGYKTYFMNCSKRISNDETYAIFTQCINPDNGSGAGTIYAYKTKMILVASDGRLEFDLVVENNKVNENPLSDNSSNLGTQIKSIIGEPFKIGNFLVAENDFPDGLKWNEAKSACAKLGKGWRLPTKSELDKIFQSNLSLKLAGQGLNNSVYWSSTIGPNEGTKKTAWVQGFGEAPGAQDTWTQDDHPCFVRAVKSVIAKH